MTFTGAFRCSKCGKEFTIDLGVGFMSEQKTPKRIGAYLGVAGQMLANSCLEHEKECAGAEVQR